MRRFPWITAGTVAVCALAALPGAGGLLQYDRQRVAAGEAWLLITCQTTHWTARMAIADLAVLLALGSWLEMGDRRRATALALGLAAIAVAAGVFLSGLTLYRGSSGLASALFVLAALEAMRPPARLSSRLLAAAALLLFAAKAVWETAGGSPLFAGVLPDNVAATPLVHLLGGLGGAAAFAVERRCREGALFSLGA